MIASLNLRMSGCKGEQVLGPETSAEKRWPLASICRMTEKATVLITAGFMVAEVELLKYLHMGNLDPLSC